VAVTGASGFIGRHVVAELRRRGHVPIVVWRPGSPAAELAAEDRAIPMDIRDPGPHAYERLGRPSVLIHLAWGGLPNYQSGHHLEEELPLHRAFLAGLVTSGLPALTVTGTCFEYGMQSGQLREDMPTAPVTAYARAKDELRRSLQRLREERPFRLTWARLFYIHGEGQAPGSLLPQLEAAIERGDPAFDMSGGEQLRDYLPVTAVADAIVGLALNGRDNDVVNVCSGRPTSVRELVEGFVRERGSAITLNLGRYPYPEHEPMAFWGDRSKLDRSLEMQDAVV
jgi:dTDP-6-deoxy-L-talose 4-dehydrogenase (NAD+)